MSEEYLILKKAIEGIKLTEDEDRLIKWIAGLDLWTVQQFVQIILKVTKVTNERKIIKKPEVNTYFYFCPNCGSRRSIKQKHNFCHDCGQALEW
ncbi:hypothetical protein CE91St56_22860 [Lachnospiraceae bacterium]|nr:hypothetical protein CE91St56_22860 [Lachnospiraceae bacterium]GKH41230.1 hypothetical protein CE91St57_22040 [Lachnospiraceae bacterium]